MSFSEAATGGVLRKKVALKKVRNIDRKVAGLQLY